MRRDNERIAVMLKIINTLIALVVLSTISYSQEIECQNGRCDVVRKVASVAVAPVVAGLQIVRDESQIILCKANESKRCVVSKARGFFSRLKCR
jgi:hypothetical protein